MSDVVSKNALKIVRSLTNAGFEAYFVGGAVRDMVMGIEPKDYDIATNASPTDIKRLFKRVIPVGEQFGVNLVVLGGKSYEVARFRMDGEYSDGRRPARIEPSSVYEDVMRRDFTINALLYDPLQCRLIDCVGGKDDIRKGIVRTVGDPGARFAEDHLRMLRAVRFSALFDFNIEPETFIALRCHASKILNVSFERIGEELSKMFTGSNPGRALSLLDETGLLDSIIPEAASMKGVPQPAQYHPEGDVFEHTRYMLELFGGGSVTLAFGVLLHDVGKPAAFTETDRIRFNRHDAVGAELTVRILRRLRFSRDVITRVRTLVMNHMRFMHVRKMRRSTLRRFIAMDGFDEMLELFRLDCLASHNSLELYEFVKHEMRSAKTTLPQPFLTGDDLIELGYEPGKIIGTILKKVMDVQLEGTVVTREDALNFVRRDFSPEQAGQNRLRKNSPSGSQESLDDTRNT